MKYLQMALFVGIAVFAFLALMEAIKTGNKGMAWSCGTSLLATAGWAHAWYHAWGYA